jgi:hypothetical protein
MKKIFFLLLLFSSILANAQYTYQIVARNLTAADNTTSANIIGSGAAFHNLTWNVSGTVSGCSVRVDGSTNGITWGTGDVIGATTCTSNGTTISSSTIKNYVRINLVTLTGAGATFTANLSGYITQPSGGGTLTSLTCGTGITCSPGSPITSTGTISSSGGTSDGLTFGTLAIGAVASGASIATNSITVATTGVAYVFCGSWGSGAATLTLTDTLTSTITSLGDTGDNTTSFDSRMHAWKVVPASNGSDAFTCAGAASGSHVDVAALYYSTPGNKVVDVSVFGNVNGDQTGKNLSITPTTTDRIILAGFSVNSAADRFSGFSGFNFPLVQNQTTSGNSFFIWERPNFPASTFSPTFYGITNQPAHYAILGTN